MFELIIILKFLAFLFEVHKKNHHLTTSPRHFNAEKGEKLFFPFDYITLKKKKHFLSHLMPLGARTSIERSGAYT